jgi:hypothetical protein
VLQKARQYNCPFWLLDVRRCPPNCARQARWLLAEFCPLVHSAFSSSEPIYGAHLVFPSHLAHYTDIVLPYLTRPTAITRPWRSSTRAQPFPGCTTSSRLS